MFLPHERATSPSVPPDPPGAPSLHGVHRPAGPTIQVFVVEPARSFERIRAQSGAFLISAFHERFEREEVLKWNAELPVYDHFVLDVPNKHKDSIVRELELLNVTRETLLPGLDEAAKAITGQYSSAPPGGAEGGEPGMPEYPA